MSSILCDIIHLIWIISFKAIVAIYFISIVNGLSVKASANMQIIFTFAKLALIAAIIIGGFVMLGQGYTENFVGAFDGTATSARWDKLVKSLKKLQLLAGGLCEDHSV